MKEFKRLLIIYSATLFFLPAYAADWQLNKERSAINYLSSKQATAETPLIFENNLFREFSGTIDGSHAELVIELNSLDTKIPIRDERIAEHVFLSKQYPQAIISATIDGIEQLNYARQQIEATLGLRGKTQDLQAEVIIERINPQTLQIQTVTPILIDADAYGMLEGFAKLKELAGLMQIPTTIPVSLHLVFEAK